MRKKGLIFLVVVSAVIAGFLFLFSDRLIEWGMEKAGTAIVGAKVEFDGVDFKLFSVNLSWDRLQVTNPRSTLRNLVETGYVDLDLTLEPLLMKRFVAQNMQADSVRFNTARQTNGALPGMGTATPGPVGRVEKLIYDELENLPSYQIVNLRELNVDSIVSILSLRSPDVIDSLTTTVDSTGRYWTSRVKDVPSSDEIARTRKQLESIQPEQIESPQDVQKALATVGEIGNRLDSLQTVIDKSAQDFKRDVEQTGRYDEVVAQAVSRDVQSALDLADLPELSSAEITSAIFGPALANTILGALNIIGTARYYGGKLREDEPKKREDPPRMMGQTIRYTGGRNWPKLWIRNMSLSAVVAGVFGKGTMRNVSSYQELIGLPIEFGIQGAEQGGGSLELRGVFDYLGEIPKDSILLSVAGIPLKGTSLTDSELFPFEIDDGQASISGSLAFIGEHFLSRAQFAGEGVSFIQKDSGQDLNKQLASAQREVIKSVSTISVEFFSEFIEDRFTLSLDSDIGRLIADILQRMLGEQMTEISTTIRREVNRRVQSRRESFQQQVANLNKAQKNFHQKQKQVAVIRQMVEEKIAALKKEAGGSLFEQFQ